MTEKEQKVNAALWRIGMVKGAQAVEQFVRRGVDLTDEVKKLSDISQTAYTRAWRMAWEDSLYFYPTYEPALKKMYQKVVDKILPF